MHKLKVVAFGVALFIPTVASAQENWTGPYVGAHVEADYSEVEFEDFGCWTACTKPTVQGTAIGGGVSAGYDAQIGDSLVIGFVADIGTGKSRKTSASEFGVPTAGKITWRSDVDFRSSMRARIGVSTGKSLIYVTGGVAIAQARFSAEGRDIPQWRATRSPNYEATWSGTLTGQTYGLGIETRFGNLSAKAEVLQTKYSPVTSCFANSDGPSAGTCWSEVSTFPSVVRDSQSSSGVRLGLNYRF